VRVLDGGSPTAAIASPNGLATAGLLAAAVPLGRA
jgi:hypothetical protein